MADFRSRPTIQRKITRQKAAEALGKEGINCTEKEATVIVDFLYLLARIAIHQYFSEVKEQG